MSQTTAIAPIEPNPTSTPQPTPTAGPSHEVVRTRAIPKAIPQAKRRKRKPA